MNCGFKVLIVDKEPLMVKFLQMYLKQKGIESQGVLGVTQALSVYSDNHFDAIVMDVCLERFSGVSFLKSIKGRGDLIPVIMMSANATREMAQECLLLGAHDFLFKPFRLSVLEEILRAIQIRKQRLVHMGVMS